MDIRKAIQDNKLHRQQKIMSGFGVQKTENFQLEKALPMGTINKYGEVKTPDGWKHIKKANRSSNHDIAIKHAQDSGGHIHPGHKHHPDKGTKRSPLGRKYTAAELRDHESMPIRTMYGSDKEHVAAVRDYHSEKLLGKEEFAKKKAKEKTTEGDKEKSIGKTNSGKSIYSKANHREHSNFTKQDHLDAVSLHNGMKDERGVSHDDHEKHFGLAIHHSQKAEDKEDKPVSEMKREELEKESGLGPLGKQDVPGYKKWRDLKEMQAKPGANKNMDVNTAQAFKEYKDNLKKYVKNKRES